MRTALVTGASGFIGARLTTLMRQAGYQVVSASSGQRSYPDAREFNLEDTASVVDAVRLSKPDIVIHLAALASVTGNSSRSYYDINALGTERLLNALDLLERRTRFVLISTAGVYGNQPSPVLSEEMPPLPVHHYGFSKFIAERLTSIASDRHDVTIIRPFNVIGKHQRQDFIVPKLVDHFLRRAPVVRLGNIDVTRDYINIDAACSIIMSAIETPATHGEIINLCSGRGTSLRELIAHLTALTGHHIEVENAAELTRKNEVWHLVGSAEKLDRLLPQRLQPLPIRDTLAEIIG